MFSHDNKPKVSILVPCFNVEKYVAQCLQSIQQQTLKDIEVICLNDGSTDCTLEIIQEIVGADPRFKIINKPNSGYGSTMNLGLSKAKGTYVGIVESDDFVEANMFKALYDQAIEHDLDISRCAFNRLINGKIKPNPCLFLPKNKTFTPKAESNAFLHPPSIWAALYRRTLLTDNNIHFLETPGAAYQDLSFAFKTTLVAKRIRCLPDPLLNYRIHQDNSVKKGNNPLIVFNEIDECILFAYQHHAKRILDEVILDIEYATFKWNYLRLPPKVAHTFFNAWVDRWRKHKLHNYNNSCTHTKNCIYYHLITKFPTLFEKYLKIKAE